MAGSTIEELTNGTISREDAETVLRIWHAAPKDQRAFWVYQLCQRSLAGGVAPEPEKATRRVRGRDNARAEGEAA